MTYGCIAQVAIPTNWTRHRRSSASDMHLRCLNSYAAAVETSHLHPFPFFRVKEMQVLDTRVREADAGSTSTSQPVKTFPPENEYVRQSHRKCTDLPDQGSGKATPCTKEQTSPVKLAANLEHHAGMICSH